MVQRAEAKQVKVAVLAVAFHGDECMLHAMMLHAMMEHDIWHAAHGMDISVAC